MPITVSVLSEDVAATINKVPSADTTIVSVPAAPVHKRVSYVKASHDQGLPQRPPELESITPGIATSGTGEKPGADSSKSNIVGPVSKYVSWQILAFALNYQFVLV